MKNESTTLARQREVKRREKRESADTELELSFSFSVVVLIHACSLVPSSQFRGGRRNFRPSSHRCG